MRLRAILFFAMTLVSIVPVVILAFWQQQQSLDNEIGSIKEKHLLVASNLTAALDRYVNDARLAFITTAENPSTDGKQYDFRNMLTEMGFRHVCTVNAEGYILRLQCALHCPTVKRFSTSVFAELADIRMDAMANPGKVYLSNLMRNPKGLPTFYFVRADDQGLLAIGELGTEYIKKVQTAITFGKGGHAAIVDKTGRVIAHPSAKWVEEMKDISKLSVIQKMMAGQSGVTQFFSPAVKADMVAGYNVVETSGWGVMIPQPFQELVDRSIELRIAVVGIAILGILISTTISWWISGMLARPLRRIADTSDRVAEGDLNIRVEAGPGLQLRETKMLTQAFNHMLERINITTQKFKAASDQANSANRAKSVFLANMSHELRTPLNAIIGFANMIRNQRLGEIENEKYIHYARDIESSGHHLLDLINDVLDISVLEQGEKQLHKELMSFGEVAAECIRTITEAGLQDDVKLELNFPKNLPQLFADQRAIKQIVLNLLSNAAKFTPKGGRISIGATVADGHHIITISDTGEGIPEHMQVNITDPFIRAETNPYNAQQGVGLGLSIVKSLVDLHGGTLKFDSVSGAGTTVTVRIPTNTDEQNSAN